MKTTVTKSDFIDQFRVMNLLENFSYEARGLLFDMLEDYEESTGQEIEMDVVAICCDYSEETPKEIAANYDIDIEEFEGDEEEVESVVMEYLNDNTFVVGVTPSGIIYQSF